MNFPWNVWEAGTNRLDFGRDPDPDLDWRTFERNLPLRYWQL